MRKLHQQVWGLIVAMLLVLESRGREPGVSPASVPEYSEILKAAETGRSVDELVLKVGKSTAREWRIQAEAGNPAAQWVYGLAVALGAGVERDRAEAFVYYRKAADQGLPAAQTWVGACYQNGFVADQNKSTAERWYQKAADQGFAEAIRKLGYCHEMGWGVPRDKEKAFDLYRTAADRGNVPAMNTVGNCYWNGFGVKSDSSKASEWYGKAADLGNVPAKESLARLTKLRTNEPTRSPSAGSTTRSGYRFSDGAANFTDNIFSRGSKSRSSEALMRNEAEAEARQAAEEAQQRFRDDLLQRGVALP